MEDLLEALRNHGWCLRGEGGSGDRGDLFRLEDDMVCWTIAKEGIPSEVQLEFHAFGDLGQRTHSLTDILYCQVVGHDEKLYFVRREKQEWHRNLERFIQYLNALVSH
jgi:hypothetical protein